MKSYVREHVNSISSIWEQKRRRDVVRGGMYVRLTAEDMDILNRLAIHFKISKTGTTEMLLSEAVRDAAEELGLWQQPEDDSGFPDGDLNN